MAPALNEVLKPARFDTEPNSPKAAKQLKHWLNVFTDYSERCEHTARKIYFICLPSNVTFFSTLILHCTYCAVVYFQF